MINSVDNMSLTLFILISFILSVILYSLSFIVSSKQSTFEKNSAYECGFESYNVNSHTIFSVQYYIIAILFLIFDLEIIYIIIWFLYFGLESFFVFNFMFFFLMLICVGFIYEWKQGAFN